MMNNPDYWDDDTDTSFERYKDTYWDDVRDAVIRDETAVNEGFKDSRWAIEAKNCTAFHTFGQKVLAFVDKQGRTKTPVISQEVGEMAFELCREIADMLEDALYDTIHAWIEKDFDEGVKHNMLYKYMGDVNDFTNFSGNDFHD